MHLPYCSRLRIVLLVLTTIIIGAAAGAQGADTTPPVISDIQASDITTTSATITWETDDPASTWVHYGTDRSYNLSSLSDPTLVTHHTVVLHGLEPGAFFHFFVTSANGQLLETRSPDNTLLTQIAPFEAIMDDLSTMSHSSGRWVQHTDGGWPTDSSHYMCADNSQSGVAATFGWYTQVPTTGHYNVYCWYKSGPDRTASAQFSVDHADGTTTTAVDQTQNGGQWVKIADRVRLDAGMYTRVQVTNQTGEADFTTKVVADAVRFVYAEQDTIPPSVPTGLTTLCDSTSSVDLSWSPSTDDISVAGYRVYRNGEIVATTHYPHAWDTDMLPNTHCSYTVSAYDGMGNESAQSAPSVCNTYPRFQSYNYITCDPEAVTWSPTPDFTFTNDGFGPGKVAYYRYKWTNTYYTWTDTEPVWSTSSMTLTAGPSSPIWYLYIRGYNEDGVGGQPEVLGPFYHGIECATIAEATSHPDGTSVFINTYLPIVADLGSYSYIEEMDRTRGLRVDFGCEGQSEGWLLSVGGILTTVNGERKLINIDGGLDNWYLITRQPLFMRIASLGGSAPDAYTPGLAGSKGLYNIGLLVRVAGKVASHSAGSFVVDDGSGATAKVYSQASVTNNTYVGVTGVCSVSNGQRIIRTRRADDVRTYASQLP